MRHISTGDQVRITGHLVNVKATNLGSPGTYDPAYFEWNSSIAREDSGAGACEVILVRDIEILKLANPVSRMLHKGSFYGLIVLILLNIVFSLARLTSQLKGG